MKYFGGVHRQNILRMWFREIFWGYRPPKYLTEPHPSIILGVYNPKYLTEPHPSNILGVYTPKPFHGCGSVKYLGAVDPPNI